MNSWAFVEGNSEKKKQKGMKESQSWEERRLEELTDDKKHHWQRLSKLEDNPFISSFHFSFIECYVNDIHSSQWLVVDDTHDRYQKVSSNLAICKDKQSL